MEFDHNRVRQVLEKDRLSSLPDELIHHIMSCFDMKFAVKTCLLSSRFKLLWTSATCLNFSRCHFGSSPKFEKFVTNVLSHRNHQVEVFSVCVYYKGVDNQVLLKTIANYAFSHNVQQLNVTSWPKKQLKRLPTFLLSSSSLKRLTLSCELYCPLRITSWDFPALTTLYLSHINLFDVITRKSIDIFSKCVSLKNLTIKRFSFKAINIIAPRLSNLMLMDGNCSKTINVVAPQLENLTIIDCAILYLKAPPGLSSFYYRGHLPQRFSKSQFHSLNKVRICLYLRGLIDKMRESRRTFRMLRELQSVRYLTLNTDIVECIFSFPDLLSDTLSPFSNLICLTIIDSSLMRGAAYKVKMFTEAKNFLLAHCPSATFIIMDLP